MSEDTNSNNQIEIFLEMLKDEDLSVQIDTIKKLPGLVQIFGPDSIMSELNVLLETYMEFMHDELLYNLAEQFEILAEQIVSNDEFIKQVLKILITISQCDEPVVRERSVKSMKSICDRLTNQQCEQTFYPLIDSLIKDDWYTKKCSAASLFSICYPKVSEERQKDLLNHFRSLIQDESPMVRRYVETALIDFIDVLETEIIKAEFVPVFDNLSRDQQDSVRVISIIVGIKIARKLKDYEIHELLLDTLKMLGTDDSWRVRQRFGFKIDEIVKVCGRKNSSEIFSLFRSCVSDIEQEVRTVSVRNLYSFCTNFKANYVGDNFDTYFAENIVPEIHQMFRDPSEEVRVALSSNILSLSSIIGGECFNANILPLAIDALENESSMPFKENMLKNLNYLPLDVDITKSFKSVGKVIKNLMENSHLHWRTRRNILLAFLHMTKYCTRDFFDEHLRDFYLYLLTDQVFAIRRIAPVILPLLIKQYGVKWAGSTLIPIFAKFSRDYKYSYKYVTLYGIDELIKPTLDKTFEQDENCKYLTSLQDIIANSEDNKIYIEVLARIVKLHEKLSTQMTLIENLSSNEDYVPDKISLYGEDTLENLKEQSKTIFIIDKSEFGGDNMCYLEGVLIFLLKEYMKVIKQLLVDTRVNVRNRTAATVENINDFVEKLRLEICDSWVGDKLEKLDEADFSRIEEDLIEALIEVEDEEFTDDMLNDELPDGMEWIYSEEEDTSPNLCSRVVDEDVKISGDVAANVENSQEKGNILKAEKDDKNIEGSDRLSEDIKQNSNKKDGDKCSEVATTVISDKVKMAEDIKHEKSEK